MKPQHQRDGDEEVLPERIAVHVAASKREKVALQKRRLGAPSGVVTDRLQRALGQNQANRPASARRLRCWRRFRRSRSSSPTLTTLPTIPPWVTTSSPLASAFEQGLVFLGLLHLRADHQEPQHDEHQDHRQQLHEATSRIGGRGGLGVGETNHFYNSGLPRKYRTRDSITGRMTVCGQTRRPSRSACRRRWRRASRP
jgi:hypothetical protein